MRWKFVTWLTIQATNLSSILLRSRNWNYSLQDFKDMPKGSLGHKLYLYLVTNNITYQPNLIRHDIKHILLNYEMKMPDELKIHAFLIGNRSYNLFGIAYLAICTAVVPEVIPKLIREFKRGKSTPCLKTRNLQNYVCQNIDAVRTQLAIR